jgi:hypothetical protein
MATSKKSGFSYIEFLSCNSTDIGLPINEIRPPLQHRSPLIVSHRTRYPATKSSNRGPCAHVFDEDVAAALESLHPPRTPKLRCRIVTQSPEMIPEVHA